MKKFTRSLSELIFPSYCLLCRVKIPLEKEKKLVCSGCIEKIALNTPPFCQKCGKKITTTDIFCQRCRKQKYHFDRAWASCSYGGNLRELLHHYKYKNKTILNKTLSRLMLNFINEYFLPFAYCDYIIPIPLSKRKLREREFNQAELLAEDLSQKLKITYLKDNLWRKKDTPSQTSLEHSARLENLKGSFLVKRPKELENKTVLLIDDVLTSGATASEAAKTLKNAGASSVLVLTLAN